MTKLSFTSVLAVALLAGCGGGDRDDGDAAAPADSTVDDDGATGDGDDASTPAVGGATTFAAELEDGTTLTVRLDVEESDPVVAPFVAFRDLAGASEPVVWIVGTLEVPADFDESAGPATGRYLTFVPPDGERVSESNPTSEFACSELDDWFGTPSGDEGAAVNEAYIEIVDSACDNQVLGVPVEAGTTTDYAMVFDGTDLPDFGSVWAGLLTELQPTG